MTPTLRNQLLSRAGATSSLPSTPDAVNRHLDAITAGKGLHKPTAAHPYAECFAGKNHTHYECDIATHGQMWRRRPTYSASYGAKLDCETYIARVQAAALEVRQSA